MNNSVQDSTEAHASQSDCKNELAKPHLKSCVLTISNTIVHNSVARNFRSEIIDCMQKEEFGLVEYMQIIN